MEPHLRPARLRRRLIVVGLVAVSLAAPCVWMLRGKLPWRIHHGADPRLSSASPFRNIRPEIAYVGDHVCATCHSEIAESYRSHPMGQSLALVADSRRVEHLEPPDNSFEAQRLLYRVEHRDEAMIHREVYRDHAGNPITEFEAQIAYVLGSGRRGRSYIFERGDRLFQSPISWFSHENRWDLGPGYHGNNQHFERPINSRCLFCHANQVRELAGNVNRFEQPIFRGHAIGCERCHGPGELHASEPNSTGGIDYSIVNPRHLDGTLREAVCQQCHLQGSGRVVRAGLSTFDYRPGLPLHDFWSVFFVAPEATGLQKAVGQVEQMQESRCYRESQGQLDCTSCHDPHRVPSAAERTEFYRSRCTSCHGTCSLPAAQRRAQSPADSCIECHMPRLAVDIPHTAMSDHRIPRRPVPDPSPTARVLALDRDPLVHFHSPLTDPDDPGLARDRGIALALLARAPEGRQARVPLGRMASALLEPAVSRWPDDVEAWESLGFAHLVQGQMQQAEECYQAALQLVPDRESALVDLAQLSYALGRRDKAIEYCRRAVETNPYASNYYAALAELYSAGQQWSESIEACENALRLNPADRETRKRLVSSSLRAGDVQRAEAELDVLIQLDPPEHEPALRRWLEDQKQ